MFFVFVRAQGDATTSASGLATADLVSAPVKSVHTRKAMKGGLAVVGEHAAALSLQNGWDTRKSWPKRSGHRMCWPPARPTSAVCCSPRATSSPARAAGSP
jgi:ketopantoate reductase